MVKFSLKGQIQSIKSRIEFCRKQPCKILATGLLCLLGLPGYSQSETVSSPLGTSESSVKVKSASVKGLFNPCSFIFPSAGYNFDIALRNGVALDLEVISAGPGCDCNDGWGFLCYFWGPVYRLGAVYYPETKMGDIVGHFGYRLFGLYAELGGGYAFSLSKGAESNISDQFFHLDPAIGINILAAHVTAGYSFRTERIDNNIGSFKVSAGFIIPLSMNGNKNIKEASKSMLKSRKSERDRLRKKNTTF